jgi:plasmid stabilization system protein ParE
MVGRKYIGKKPPAKLRLLIQQRFFDNLHTIEMYGATLFGEKVAEQFHNGLMSRITTLPSFPKANPKYRFVPSTEKKEYRVIVYKKFYVVYSVTSRTIKVLTIIHQATNPKKLSKIK